MTDNGQGGARPESIFGAYDVRSTLGVRNPMVSRVLSGIITEAGEYFMGKRFTVGDHVTWNSEAGYVSGRIIRVHMNERIPSLAKPLKS